MMIYLYSYCILCAFIFCMIIYCNWYRGSDLTIFDFLMASYASFVPVLNLIALFEVAKEAGISGVLLKGRNTK